MREELSDRCEERKYIVAGIVAATITLGAVCYTIYQSHIRERKEDPTYIQNMFGSMPGHPTISREDAIRYQKELKK